MTSIISLSNTYIYIYIYIYVYTYAIYTFNLWLPTPSLDATSAANRHARGERRPGDLPSRAHIAGSPRGLEALLANPPGTYSLLRVGGQALKEEVAEILRYKTQLAWSRRTRQVYPRVCVCGYSCLQYCAWRCMHACADITRSLQWQLTEAPCLRNNPPRLKICTPQQMIRFMNWGKSMRWFDEDLGFSPQRTVTAYDCQTWIGTSSFCTTGIGTVIHCPTCLPWWGQQSIVQLVRN